MKNEVIIFENQEIKLGVNMKDETVWLNLDQISQLFQRDKSVISRHIKNIFKEGELEKSVVAKFATVQKEGERKVLHFLSLKNIELFKINYLNLILINL